MAVLKATLEKKKYPNIFIGYNIFAVQSSVNLDCVFSLLREWQLVLLFLSKSPIWSDDTKNFCKQVVLMEAIQQSARHPINRDWLTLSFHDTPPQESVRFVEGRIFSDRFKCQVRLERDNLTARIWNTFIIYWLVSIVLWCIQDQNVSFYYENIFLYH